MNASDCQCGVRAATACPGAWEPGCDLGCNAEHVRVGRASDEVRGQAALALDPAPMKQVGWVVMNRENEPVAPSITATQYDGMTASYDRVYPEHAPHRYVPAWVFNDS